jgi:uncharacterized membrane protein YccC
MIDPFLMTIIVAVVTGVVIIVVIALVWLVRTHLKLKHDYQVLADVVHGHNNDIADLCAAALTADGYMAATDEQISVLCAKISDYQHNEPSTHPYSLVIQKVRNGASVSELMQNSGLSQDEAALLIRLHGSKAQV